LEEAGGRVLFSGEFDSVKSGLGVEKVTSREGLSAMGILLPRFFLSLQLSGGGQNRGYRLAKESYQSLEVLGGRGQEELRRSPI
jgi:hypothetical protein